LRLWSYATAKQGLQHFRWQRKPWSILLPVLVNKKSQQGVSLLTHSALTPKF